MDTLKLFSSLEAARDYRHTEGSGGWIFHNAELVILFPPDWYPSKIFHHPLLKGHQGALVGPQ